MILKPAPRFFLLVFLAALVFSSCATVGLQISKEELRQNEEEFQRKFLQASETWMPRIYRVGYQLLRHHVPDHGAPEPQFKFIGVGVAELKDYGRKAYGVDKPVKGVLVRGLYPGSEAEGADIRLGDVVTDVDGHRIDSLGDYFKRVRKTDKKEIVLKIWRKGETRDVSVPVEDVYYNAQFFLGPTPNFEASSLFSKIEIGIGAIRYSRNDDELAFIMGHELAHTTRKHSAKMLGASIGTAVMYGAVAGVIEAFTLPGVGSAIVQPALQAHNAKIARDYEREADYFGMKHAFHSGYDVKHGARVFSRLASDAPGFEVLAMTFATHPATPERYLRLEKIGEEFENQFPEKFPMRTNPEWELTIPLVPGETVYEAVDRLLEEQKKEMEKSAEVTGPAYIEIKAGLDAGIEMPSQAGSLPAGRTEEDLINAAAVMKDFDFGLEPTTSEINTASSASPDTLPASGYQAPSK